MVHSLTLCLGAVLFGGTDVANSAVQMVILWFAPLTPFMGCFGLFPFLKTMMIFVLSKEGALCHSS